MRQTNVTVGGCYEAKVSGRVVTVRVDRIEDWPGHRYVGAFKAKGGKRYHGTNLATGRPVAFKSARKFRRAVSDLDREWLVRQASTPEKER